MTRISAGLDVANVTGYSNFALPAEKSACKMVDADNMDELAGFLKNEAKVI